MAHERRHSRWYERILFNGGFHFVVGVALIVLLPTLVIWPVLYQTRLFDDQVQYHTTAANFIAFVLTFVMYKRIQAFPGARSLTYLLPLVLVNWSLVVVGILFLRLDYSRPAIVLSFILANIGVALAVTLGRRYYCLKLAVVPYGNYQELEQFKSIDTRILIDPMLGNTRFDAVVADLRSDMPNEWQTFLANCALANIPVYHSQQMVEQLTGRVKITHLSENIFGALYTRSTYGMVKRCAEIVFVLLLLPIWLPLMLIFGLLVKLESQGPMFFTQERVGLGDQDFTVYKLRSMCKDSEKQGAQFATQGDARVTRIGKFIRKTRIDEIPQFINILKGDMSLIGPRPEQRIFVEQFKQEIPFYSYRHVVRPGISGWAQVTQGYAANSDETSIKLEYDLYYIKHFSFWLDVLIVFKTIKTMLTGFGAR
ncbi:exopolysaccharide biosynthesis polyprenyl glycosylphosphotransferase [Wohlfahrtiimonas chitiniclastica]|uniref:exopolysaccharide biosynthesis polyprenyl glycosylphosphotransferase n=1 Tax=Wohlfahrtiimonas chitiniclastica TaxID=400946 RepID=UPI001FEF7672|nr:exopolysaccharide biosynthesis polyprenyl glycosylphosphotransferase [Wohlfahrtiimonas chitiniclastica]